jgi:hypothetical protein
MDQGSIRGLGRRMVGALGASAVAVLLAAAGASASGASPGPLATAGGATSVTATSAQLNGVVEAGSPVTASFFQYSTSPRFTPVAGVSATIASGPGLHAVSALVAHLAPDTTYYFRLGVVYVPEPGLPQTGVFGPPAAFRTTAAAPAAGLPGFGPGTYALRVRAGAATIPVACAGPAGAQCSGVLSVDAVPRRLRCGWAPVALAAPSRRQIRVTLTRACVRLLASAQRHSLRATLILASGSGSASHTAVLTG